MSQPFDQGVLYPDNSVPRQVPSSHSDGSFGPVFIILAIILVISLVACVVGRVCSKRHHKSSKPKPANPVRSKEKGSSGRQKYDDFDPHKQGGDVELGFEMKPIPSSKVAASDGFRNFKPSYHHHGGPGGPGKGQVRFAGDHIDFKPGPMQHSA